MTEDNPKPSVPTTPPGPEQKPSLGKIVEFLSGTDVKKRDRVVVQMVARVSGLLALVSILIGLSSSFWNRPFAREVVGTFLVAFWGVVPPLWFWYEWSFLTNDFTK